MTIQDAFNLAAQKHQAGHLAEAEAIYRKILIQMPDHADSLHHLGMIGIQMGRHADAVELINRAIAANPKSADLHGTLGMALKGLNRIAEAIAEFQLALKLNPNLASTCNNLGNVFFGQGNTEAAAECFNRALEIQPTHSDALFNLGNLHKSAGRFENAIARYRQALAHRPQWPAALNNMGTAHRGLGQLDPALDCYRKAIQMAPQFAEAINNYADGLLHQGKAREALHEYDRALAAGPNASIAGNRVFMLHFHPDFDAQAILREARRFDEQYARPLAQKPPQVRLESGSRLRIGYVSSTFRLQVLRFYTTPLFRHHDRDRFEIFCYSDVPQPDTATARIKSLADQWRQTNSLDDAALADLIRRDEIDILVDLNMHMAPSRPLVFARKPAPIQIAFMAYPGTTGLSAMDYRLTDPYLDPLVAFDDCYSEQSIRLPDSFWCFDPELEPTPSPVIDPPAHHAGHITFGCLNGFCKINPSLLKLWACVLNAVPNSRLLMLSSTGESRRWVTEVLAQQRIAADRLEFVDFQPRYKYLAEYNRIDLCLDTLPYNGHTTTLDALWMGVPVVTRVGSTVVGRGCFSQLSNLGLTELAGNDDTQFVKIAADLAGDLPRLSDLRRTLRARMTSSPLMDAPRFARNIEAVYMEVASRSEPHGQE